MRDDRALLALLLGGGAKLIGIVQISLCFQAFFALREHPANPFAHPLEIILMFSTSLAGAHPVQLQNRRSI